MIDSHEALHIYRHMSVYGEHYALMEDGWWMDTVDALMQRGISREEAEAMADKAARQNKIDGKLQDALRLIVGDAHPNRELALRRVAATLKEIGESEAASIIGMAADKCAWMVNGGKSNKDDAAEQPKKYKNQLMADGSWLFDGGAR